MSGDLIWAIFLTLVGIVCVGAIIATIRLALLVNDKDKMERYRREYARAQFEYWQGVVQRIKDKEREEGLE